MKFRTFTAPIAAAAVLIAATGCATKPEPPTVAEMTPEARYAALLKIRGYDKVCHSGDAACERWTELMLGCENETTRTCMAAEQLRERVTGIELSSAPGAYDF